MPAREDAYQRNQQSRWLRPDGHRWLRPDAARFLKPGAEGTKTFPVPNRKYSPSQRRVPAGRSDGGQWTSGDGGGGIVDTIGSFVDIPLQFVSMEWGTLIAELRPAFGTDTGRLCVYQFGDQSVIVPGPNNFSSQPNVTWASTWHGQILNDNVRRRF